MGKKVVLLSMAMMALLVSCTEDKKSDNYVAAKVYANLYNNGKINQGERILLEEYHYDETGKITTMLRYRDAKGVECYKEEYQYNEANKIIASKYYAPNGNLWFSRSVIYNNDSTIAEIKEDVGGTHFTYQYKHGNGGRSIRYNQEGQLQEDSTVLYIINGKNFSLVNKYEYGDGLIKSKTLLDNGKPIAFCTYEYISGAKR